jgi:micrococcal nuclease
MNGFVRLTALLALLWVSAAPAQEPTIRGRCVATVDGDTIKVLIAEKELVRVRVAWIDAPEMGQAFGMRAKQAMSKLVFGQDVEVRFQTIDRYGRMVAMVFVKGSDAGLELGSGLGV